MWKKKLGLHIKTGSPLNTFLNFPSFLYWTSIKFSIREKINFFFPYPYIQFTVSAVSFCFKVDCESNYFLQTSKTTAVVKAPVFFLLDWCSTTIGGHCPLVCHPIPPQSSQLGEFTWSIDWITYFPCLKPPKTTS